MLMKQWKYLEIGKINNENRKIMNNKFNKGDK